MSFQIQDFQHDRDSTFAGKILNSDAAKSIMAKFHETNLESVYTYLYQSSCPRLTQKTSPKLFSLLKKACEMFSVDKIPEIYVTRDYDEMVSVRGVNAPFLVFSSEFLRKLDDNTLFGILAGQAAAIRCQHHVILYLTWGFDFASSMVPGSDWVVEPIINNWLRCRYFTYDRAFALATKNRALTLRQILINVVPQNILDEMNCGTSGDVYLKQAEKFLNTMKNNRTQATIRTAISMYSYKIWLPERYDEINKFFDGRGF